MSITHRTTTAIIGGTQWNETHVFSITTATVNFGSTPVHSKTFTVVDADSTTANKVFICGTAVSDEAEMDSITYAAKSNNGTITVYANAQPGPVSGERTFYYFLGE